MVLANHLNNKTVSLLTVIDINRFSTSSRNVAVQKGDLRLSRVNCCLHSRSGSDYRFAFRRPRAVETLEEMVQPAPDSLVGHANQEIGASFQEL